MQFLMAIFCKIVVGFIQHYKGTNVGSFEDTSKIDPPHNRPDTLLSTVNVIHFIDLLRLTFKSRPTNIAIAIPNLVTQSDRISRPFFKHEV